MVTSAKLRHCAKFCADRSNRCGDIMISLFFKMAAAAILEFLATVCKTVRSMLSVRCPVCLSVSLSVCSVRALWPNDWTDQDETRRAGRPRAWPHCVRWGPSSPSPKGAQPPIYGPYQLRPNGCMDQDVTWHGARPRPRRLCIRWGPRSPPQKGAEAPNFRPVFIVAKRLDGCNFYLAWW